jgi:prepilin-type N-terminal cleavage/methylation domain-containing protein
MKKLIYIAHANTMNRNVRKKERGFTLIEILIVIGIIAILAGIVLVAINPARQFRQANNTQRESNVNAILNAIGQYTVDNKGALPGEIQDDEDPIGGASGTDWADLCDALVPTYLAALPVDPLTEQTDSDLAVDDQSIDDTECSEDYLTGYVVEEQDGRVVVSAPETEDVDAGGTVPAADRISVTR